MVSKKDNLDKKTVDGFGDEWTRFDQSQLDNNEQAGLFEKYFAVFPWAMLHAGSVGFDLGCGSGRWAKLVAPRVGRLHCIDPSDAIEVAKRNLEEFDNCDFYRSSVDLIPLPDESMDFGYSLGVLHHIPDTSAGLRSCVQKLKVGAPFLVYLYYNFDNKPFWYVWIWCCSELFRALISRLPNGLRYSVSQLFAAAVYLPLARLSLLLEKVGVNVNNIPLSSYRNLSFYTMRTDALDRFGTSLERRFSKIQIEEMMIDAGLERIEFSSDVPYWCAVGYRKVD
jgi:ubiquinone/menaquinone biosynthesis C-methylase UbiE